VTKRPVFEDLINHQTCVRLPHLALPFLSGGSDPMNVQNFEHVLRTRFLSLANEERKEGTRCVHVDYHNTMSPVQGRGVQCYRHEQS